MSTKESNERFPEHIFGDRNRPVILLLNSSPLDFNKAYNTRFIEKLCEQYCVIALSFPKIKSNSYGYTFIELLSMFHNTLLHFNLLKEFSDEVLEVGERIRRMSKADETAVNETMTFRSFSSSRYAEYSQSPSNSMISITSENGETQDEGGQCESGNTREEDEETCPAPKPACYPRHPKEHLILDDHDEGDPTDSSERQHTGSIGSFSSTYSPSRISVNIFNVQDVKEKNEEILFHRTPTTSGKDHTSNGKREEKKEVVEAEEEKKDPICNDPFTAEEKAAIESAAKKFQPFAEKDQSFLLPAIPVNTIAESRLVAVIGQDYFSNYFLLNYQNQFPQHMPRYILCNHGIKNIYTLSDILHLFTWQWFCAILFLGSRKVSDLLATILFSVAVKVIIFWMQLKEWGFVYRWLLRKSMLFIFTSGLSEVDAFHHRFEAFRLWKEEMMTLQINDLYLYYQLWRMRFVGYVLQPRFPENCHFYFLYESGPHNRYYFDEEFLVSFATRATAVKEDLRKATDDPFLKDSETDLLTAHRVNTAYQGILAYLPQIQDIPPAWKTSLGLTYRYSPELLVKKIQAFIDFTK